MAVIITDMIMPVSCAWCVFGQRIDNNHTMCLRNPFQIPIPDTDGRPEYCPLKYVDNETLPDCEKLIKGIEECDLNGGMIGNCPYKEILLLLKDRERWYQHGV